MTTTLASGTSTASDVEVLRGWGRTHRSRCRVVQPTDVQELMAVVADSTGQLLPRGSGCSYGDASTHRRGTVIDVRALRRLIALDSDRGIAVVEAGMTLGELVRIVTPRGWIPPVLPGTPYVSIGGAVAADIHGKNHVGAGSFGRHVRWLVLVDADGRSRMLTPERDHDHFWATVGGMGLTGIVTTVALQLIPCGSGSATTRRHRAPDLHAVLDRLEATAVQQRDDPLLHVVAWLDCSAPRRVRGRGLVQTTRVPVRHASQGVGDHRSVETAHDELGNTPHRGSLPGPGLISRAGILAANRARWCAPVPGHDQRSSISSALQPLRRAELWPALFGREGLVQYQFVVPASSVHVIGAALDLLSEHHTPPALSVLKRLGRCDPAPLSFATDGWTLALDLPARWPGLEVALGELDAMVAQAHGRVYLAKDSRMSADTLTLMYPRLGEWQQTRSQMDPRSAFASDLSRRLHLSTARVAP